MAGLSPERLFDFELRLPRFRATIAAAGNFCGNDAVFGLVVAFIRTGALPRDEIPAVVE